MKFKKFRSWVIENIFLRLGDWILGTSVIKHLKEHRKYAVYSADQLNELQLKKLKLILTHATTTCNAYKNLNIKKDDTIEWLHSFPILYKKDLTLNGFDYISSSYKIDKLIRYESSGSSGQRSVIYIDKQEESLLRAILILWWEWNGYYFGKPILQTGMSPNRGLIKKIKDKLLSTSYMVAFDLSEEEIIKHLNRVSHIKNINLFGYASSLYLIAKTAKKFNLSNRFDLAMSQGDKLFDHYQSEISSSFACNVVEDYGLNEGFMVGQKADLPYYYIYTPSVFLEILDENGCPVKDGELGRIVLTKLDGYAMPLIRFDTGDLGVKLPENKYPVKRKYSFPLLEKVIGRNTDIIKTKDNKFLIVHTFTGIFEFFPEIEQFQVIQNIENQILICYIPSESFTNSILQRIEAEIYFKTNSDIEIMWKQVDFIPPSSSGKPQIVVNNLIRQSLSNLS